MQNKKLYFESSTYFKKRRNNIIHLMLPTAGILIVGIIFLIYSIVYNPNNINDHICILIVFFPISIIGLCLFYFLNYKPLNRFIIYNDGFYKRFNKKFINFKDINYFRIDYYKKNTPVIHIYFENNSHEWYVTESKKAAERIKQIFMEKGLTEKTKRKWYE